MTQIGMDFPGSTSSLTQHKAARFIRTLEGRRRLTMHSQRAMTHALAAAARSSKRTALSLRRQPAYRPALGTTGEMLTWAHASESHCQSRLMQFHSTLGPVPPRAIASLEAAVGATVRRGPRRCACHDEGDGPRDRSKTVIDCCLRFCGPDLEAGGVRRAAQLRLLCRWIQEIACVASASRGQRGPGRFEEHCRCTPQTLSSYTYSQPPSESSMVE